MPPYDAGTLSLRLTVQTFRLHQRRLRVLSRTRPLLRLPPLQRKFQTMPQRHKPVARQLLKASLIVLYLVQQHLQLLA